MAKKPGKIPGHPLFYPSRLLSQSGPGGGPIPGTEGFVPLRTPPPPIPRRSVPSRFHRGALHVQHGAMHGRLRWSQGYGIKGQWNETVFVATIDITDIIGE